MTTEADYVLIYGESGYLKILDTQYMGFSKKGINTITMGTKKILGAITLHGVEDFTELFMGTVTPYRMKVKIQVGKTVKFKIQETGQEQNFKMSTAIGTPTKVLKLNKSDWYAFR